MNDDELIKEVQTRRLALVRDIVENNAGQLPKSTEDRAMYLAALRDIGTTALGNKKIGSDEKIADASTRAIVSAVLHGVGPKTGRKVIDVTDVSEIDESTLPELDDRIPRPELVPNELRQGGIDDNYDAFKRRMAGEPEEATEDE